MQDSESIAQGLSLNTLQRIHNQTREGSSNFITQNYEALIREIMGISLKDMFKIGGMNVWANLQSRCKHRSQMLSFMAGSMAKMHSTNEKSKEKLSSMVQGNSVMIEQEKITIQEATILEKYNITYASQLFDKSVLTGIIELDKDIEYPI